jgi:DNA-binding CsgD family transcriptional regulator
MSEYLSKEEIRQWRSSLEKITLEEFAARLGKKIEHEAKTSEDLIDKIFHGNPTVVSQEDIDWRISRSERLNAIAERSFSREREISATPFSAESIKSALSKSLKPEKNSSEDLKPAKATKAKTTKTSLEKSENKTVKKTSSKSETTSKKLSKAPAKKAESAPSLREEVRIVLKKALTDREQKVFDYFSENTNKIVYAKDLAELLDLPRDYVYKYIKNLRAKIDGDNLKNADKGGFILSI